MRFDIENSGNRGLFQKLLLAGIRRYVGTVPGPMLFLSYDSAQIPREMLNYMVRSVRKQGFFTKGERELFAAFVSKLNSCNF